MNVKKFFMKWIIETNMMYIKWLRLKISEKNRHLQVTSLRTESSSHEEWEEVDNRLCALFFLLLLVCLAQCSMGEHENDRREWLNSLFGCAEEHDDEVDDWSSLINDAWLVVKAIIGGWRRRLASSDKSDGNVPLSRLLSKLFGVDERDDDDSKPWSWNDRVPMETFSSPYTTLWVRFGFFSR